MKRSIFCAVAVWMLLVSATLRAEIGWRASSPDELARDAAAFNGIDQAMTESLADVQSVVVALKGRLVHEYYRDGAPDKLRDVQSVAKSALTSSFRRKGLPSRIPLSVTTSLPPAATPPASASSSLSRMPLTSIG